MSEPTDEMDLVCHNTPPGWRCTRGAGHEGPCAAVEEPEDLAFVARAMQRLKDVDDAARFRWLCAHPDWQFVELLCQEFVAESAEEFYQGLCAAIDKHRRMEASADGLRDQINAAMGGRPPTPR